MISRSGTGLPIRSTVVNGPATISVLAEGEGLPIVLLPSLGRGQSDHDAIARGLVERGFRVLRPDPRGIDGSTGPLEGITLEDLAGDIAAIIKAEGRPAIVAGHAFGNFVARMTGASHPDLVLGVAMLAGSAGWVPSGESPYDEDVRRSIFLSSDLSLPPPERIVHLQRAFFAPGNDPTVWLDGWNGQVKALQSAALRATPVEAWFAAGKAPILDLQAEHDAVAQRKFAHVLREAVGERVSVVVVPNAGHALLPEQPEAVVRHLAEWANELRMTGGHS